MSIRIAILLLILSLSPVAGAQDKFVIDWDYSGLAFGDFVLRTEKQLNIKFFYEEAWISELILGEFAGETTLQEILDNLLKDKGLFYFVHNTNNIIISKGYAIKDPSLTYNEGDSFLPSFYEPESGATRQFSDNVPVEIGNPSERYKPGNAILSGYLKNADTHEFIAGATIFNQKTSQGTISNEYGFYSLSLPRGNHLLQYSFIGMKEKRINIVLNGDGELDLEMQNVLIPLKETVISAQKNMILQRYEVGLEKINIVIFKLMPSVMGESDILKNLLLIPGVKSVGEGSAGFNVRGGSSDQNLILLYGAPVYNPSHFFGFFSAVNSDIIKDVNLYKGGIPARYGGRISSVLDISSRDGDKNEFKGNAGISPVTTHIMIEGPVTKNKSSFLLNARNTYSNWILGLVKNPYIKNSSVSFYDINGRFTSEINSNNKLEFSSYYSYDSFRFNSDTNYTYNNTIVSLRWRHFFTTKFFSVATLNNSHYKYDISGQKETEFGFKLAHKVTSTNFKTDFNWYPGSRNEINFGLDMTRYSVMPGSYLPGSDSSLVIPDVSEREKALESALFIEDKLLLTEKMSVSIGLRMSSFFAYGPRNLNIYYPGFERSNSTITDTLSINPGKIYRTYAGPEFRISWNFKMNDNSSIKLNYNRTRQYLHLLSNTTSISPTDTWKLSDYYLEPEIGDQFAIGIYRMLFHNKIETSTEVYFKNTRNMIDFKGGASLLMNETIEQELVNLRSKAYGIELMIKKSVDKLRWNIGYTYSRVFSKSVSEIPEETINSGNWFPANFDRPNNLNISISYLYSRRVSLSSSYTYSTGRPITYPVAIYKVSDLPLIHFSERNKYRIPDYFRLDFSVMISGNLKSNRIAHPYWSFSIYNVLGRQNVYSIYFKNEQYKVRGYKLSVFGRPIPSITYSFDF